MADGARDWSAPATLVALLDRHGFHASDEHELQAGIERVLCNADVPHEREYALSPSDRVDFLVAGIRGEALVEKLEVDRDRVKRLAENYLQR